MTKSSAMEFAVYGIRFNSGHPGVIETPMISQGDTALLVKQLEQMIPLKRIAQSEELTSLVLFPASDESSYSTGFEFIADSGLIAKY